jgi:hypothetical protein
VKGALLNFSFENFLLCTGDDDDDVGNDVFDKGGSRRNSGCRHETFLTLPGGNGSSCSFSSSAFSSCKFPETSGVLRKSLFYSCYTRERRDNYVIHYTGTVNVEKFTVEFTSQGYPLEIPLEISLSSTCSTMGVSRTLRSIECSWRLILQTWIHMPDSWKDTPLTKVHRLKHTY